MKIKVGDKVRVITGSNKGKEGKVSKKMLDEKMSLESISRLTGLNITEIKKIAK